MGTKAKLIMCKGLPASGKSTWAKQQVKDNPKKVTRVNKDDLREMMHLSNWSKGNENEVVYARNAIVGYALSNGKTVIVDDTNFASVHEYTLREIALACNADFEIKVFDADLDTCIKRDARRENPVGRKVILDMYEKYVKVPPPVIEFDPRLPECVIVDVDGTLAHMSGRSPYDPSRYMEDTFDHVVASIADLYRRNAGAKVIVVTGRDGEYVGVTKEWLEKHEFVYHAIFSRPAGDNRNDAIIKREIYEREIKGKYNVLFVLDDRDRVVRMWREQGLKVFQVAEGNF